MHVAGAVRNPGIVDVLPGAIVADAIEAAGGALPGADLDSLNLAASVGPGERVFVPLPGTAAPAVSGIPAISTAGLDLNRASAAELETLPGIGPSLASAIIQYREQNGPFQSVEELLQCPRDRTDAAFPASTAGARGLSKGNLQISNLRHSGLEIRDWRLNPFLAPASALFATV